MSELASLSSLSARAPRACLDAFGQCDVLVTPALWRVIAICAGLETGEAVASAEAQAEAFDSSGGTMSVEDFVENLDLFFRGQNGWRKLRSATKRSPKDPVHTVIQMPIPLLAGMRLRASSVLSIRVECGFDASGAPRFVLDLAASS